MLHTLRTQGARRFLVLEAPPFAAAILVAEAFFKFGSFALEALAFGAVWVVVGLPYQAVVERLRGTRGTVDAVDAAGAHADAPRA